VHALQTSALFVATALAELGGCYLVFLWLRRGASSYLTIAAAGLLAAFAWLLTLHPNVGRAYAAYGGVYVACAVLWGWWVDGQPPDRWDLVGAAVSIAGMLLIAFAPRG
jgi:small multidrug resistance family-3 protein